MSFAATLFQAPLTAVPFAHLFAFLAELTLLGGLLMFFRPLLIGIARALVLVVRPRPTKDELAARRKLRQAQVLQQAAQAAVPGSAEVRAMRS